MKKIALFPGSFDPITKGHESIVLRAMPLFDKIVVAIGVNAAKKTLFSLEERLTFLKQCFGSYENIEITYYEGLTINFCKKIGALYILRGLRTSADFEFERSIGQINKKMAPEINTVFLLATTEYTPLNSSIIRDIYLNGGDISQFVPDKVKIPRK